MCFNDAIVDIGQPISMSGIIERAVCPFLFDKDYAVMKVKGDEIVMKEADNPLLNMLCNNFD